MKKAISAATSAALVASLLATAFAPAAMAAVTVGSAGNVPVGGTSANNVSFTFTEQTATSLANSAGNFTVVIAPSIAGAGTVSFSGIPSVVGSTGSLGASASITGAGNVLAVSFAGSDTANIESIVISGLKISASSGFTAAQLVTPAITATITGFGGQFASALAVAAAFTPATSAQGTLSTGYAAGTTSVTVNVSGTCAFAVTAGAIGTLDFATLPESKNVTTAGALNTPGPGQQVLTIAATGNNHQLGEAVSQANPACGSSVVLASPGTVVNAVTYASAGNATVFPGENNSPASNLSLTEPVAGFLAAASTFTFKIATAGVVFSSAPAIQGTAAITGISIAAAAVVTTATPHGLVSGQTVTISGANSTPTIDGSRVVTVLSATTFSVPVTTTIAGTTGLVTTAAALGGMVLSAPVLSADRLSATVTVTTASTTPATIVLNNIRYDVASTVPAGTFVSVGLTTSAAQAVLPATNTNAVVFRGIAASAPSPTVYIGENNQTAGLITFKEAAPGFFTDGVGTATNTFAICPTGVNYTFTLAPVAVVTGGVAAGNIILRDGAAASTTNIVAGTAVTLFGLPCFQWTVWTASTTASTIVIGAAPSAATGGLINVSVSQAPGGVDAGLFIGSSTLASPMTLAATVQFATAVYRNQVAVTALSQPSIAPGSTHAAAGNLQIAETSLGQLKALENICVDVLWNSGTTQNAFLNGLATADLPVATASGTGLVIGPVNASQVRCGGESNSAVPANYMQSFTFQVLQQSTAGDGKLVISNISYTVLTGAVSGPVQVSVFGLGGSPTGVIFHSTVSNAIVGAASKLSIGAVSALGLKPTTGYTNKTPKIQVKGKYVTWKFTGGHTLAGQRVNVMVAKKVGGAWGGPVYLKSAVADANGIVTFAWKFNTAAAINVRVQWPGSTSLGVSSSKALGAYWK